MRNIPKIILFVAAFVCLAQKVDAQCSSGTVTQAVNCALGYYSGDGLPANDISVGVSNISNLAVDSAGDIFFVDQGVYRVRKVSAATGIISTIAIKYSKIG